MMDEAASQPTVRDCAVQWSVTLNGRRVSRPLRP